MDLSVRLDILLPEIVVSGTVCFQDSREFFAKYMHATDKTLLGTAILKKE